MTPVSASRMQTTVSIERIRDVGDSRNGIPVGMHWDPERVRSYFLEWEA